jgi:hypothetical protein
MAELVNIHQEFHLGNLYTLEVAQELASNLPDRYRVIVKYDQQDMPSFEDSKLNIEISTSREIHDLPKNFFLDSVHMIFQNYCCTDSFDRLKETGGIVHPMPIGTFVNFDNAPEPKPIPERKYDFTFVGQIPNTGTRDCFKRNLDKLMIESDRKFKYKVIYTDGFSRGLASEDYINLLNDSKIVLCPSGASSPETFRFFEALKMGALPMVDRLPAFWYYLNAPFAKTSWWFIEHSLCEVLNSLNSKMCRNISYQIASYNMTILNPSWMGRHLSSVVLKRDENLPDLKNIRQEMGRAYV